MKTTKRMYMHSVIALLLSISMLIGTTFAWFSDNITSKKNIITSGNLDLEMYWTDDLDSGKWYNVEDEKHNTIFSYDNWEPGYTDVKYIKLVNKGDLALNYNLSIEPQSGVGKLAEVINVYYANDGIKVASRDDLAKMSAIGLLNNVMNGGATVNGTLLAADQYSPLHTSGETIITLAMSMITTAGNDYQNKDAGEFTINALATQAPFEKDSFGSDYDANAEYPVILKKGSATADIVPVDGKVPVGGVTLSGDGISAVVPEGTLLEDGVDKLTLTVTPLKNTTSDIIAVNSEVLIPVDVHIDGVSENNTTPIIIDLGEVLPKYLNMGNYHLFHVEDGQSKVMTHVNDKENLNAHNQFAYDSDTGAVTVAMASFSEVVGVADTSNPWQGNVDYSWYNTTDASFTITKADQLYAFAKIVGGMTKDSEKDIVKDSFSGKTVKLLSDINLNHGKFVDEGGITKIFYPIGYYNKINDDASGYYDRVAEVEGKPGVTSNVSSFSGTFDGNGHKISNFYQNTWEMFGDYNDGYSGTPNYYKDAMGLFGYVNGGTIKNLTVDSFESDGEFTPTGVIAAYAVNSTFENIAITHCNPRVYNTGNGGIVGIGGNSDDTDAKSLNFKNITVDNTNKISALWGSWDVACGGLMGMFRGNSLVNFTNCHVAAQVDVYNDVCGNYQYYWYRYSGMMIGSLRGKNVLKDGCTVPNMDDITATGCSVSFDAWNDYYYCELVDNSIASYTHDHQFSRLVEVKEVDVTNKTYIPVGSTETQNIPTSGRYNYVVVTDKITPSTEEAICYHFVNGVQHKHESKGTEIVDGKEYLVEDKQHIYLPFNQVFQGDGWGVKHIPISGEEGSNLKDQGYPALDIQILNRNSVEKFDSKFTGDFLYRVGNLNTISIGSLFKAKESADINDSGVWVTVEKLSEEMNIKAKYEKSTTENWEDGTLKFEGTGVAKITIQDYNYCKPTSILVEVVDAVNATGAINATTNNVVLLKDCDFSSLEVSDGYTLFGNGFTMTCGSDSVAIDRTYSFLELKGGTLDNVKIVAPNFSHAIMYEKNKTENGNPSNTDSTGRTRYYNIRSAVKVTADSKITNSYISGGRAAIYAVSGTLAVENSTIYGGAVANIQAEASSNLVLEDVTLIQKPIKANVNDTSKKMMGFSVVMMCDTTGTGAPVTLKGYLHQYAWANNDYKTYVPSDAQDVVTDALSKTEYVHSITYADGVTRDSICLGFAYMPDGITATKAENMNDQRSQSEKNIFPYEKTTVQAIASIYTYKNTNGTDVSVKNEPIYSATTQGAVIPEIRYEDVNDNRVFTTTYDATKAQWKSTLKVDVDAGAYDFNFDKLLVQKNGKNLSYTVTTENGTAVDNNATITLNSAVSNVYVLTITDNQIYDKDGNTSGVAVEHSYIFELLATKTSLPEPTWMSKVLGGTPYIVVDSKGGDWNCAVPVLDGLKVKYWSKKQNKEIELDLANVVSDAGLSKGLQNGSNNTITITVADEYTLQITTTGFKSNDNGKPVVVNGKLYFTVSSSSNYVSTSTTERTPNISYVFTDANNSDSITLNTSFKVVYAEHKSTQYKYSSFCNGSLEQASSGGCVTPDTLVTLADGTQKEIQHVTYEDKLLVWDFFNGKYTTVPSSIIFNMGTDYFKVIALTFEDGTTVKIINGHRFFDKTENKYVLINETNVKSYLGHDFVKVAGNSYGTVKLVNYSISKEYTTSYSLMSAYHYNFIVEGMFSDTFHKEDAPLFEYFTVGNNMKYDETLMKEDIAQYGLYTYEEFAEYLTYEQFVALNVQYMKISVGKGQFSYEGILSLIEMYLSD